MANEQDIDRAVAALRLVRAKTEPEAQRELFAEIVGFAHEMVRVNLEDATEERSGQLYGAIGKRVQMDRGELVGQVNVRSRGFYWRFLEFGTVRSRAFPFVEPTVDEHGDDWADAIDGQVGRVVLGAG